MIDHLGINCADWEKSKAFYDEVLGVLGYTPAAGLSSGHRIRQGRQARLLDRRHERGRGGGPNREVHVAFHANDHDAVQAFYDTALELGAESLHAPRLWPEYHPGYFGAFVRDPDGNNVEAVFHGAPPQ